MDSSASILSEEGMTNLAPVQIVDLDQVQG